MTLDETMKEIDERLSYICKTSIKIISLTGLFYIGAFTLGYEVVDSNYRTVLEENLETNLKINYNNIFNPLKFYQDNQIIIDQGSNISKSKDYAPFSVISITGG